MTTSSAIPPHARIVIVGGGIAGSSLAYHLARNGERDVLLLEQNQIGAGTTHHAAGMVARMRPSKVFAGIADHSAHLYAALEEETGVATGWSPVGSLLLAQTHDRLVSLRRAASLARIWGIASEEIGPREAGELWPGLRTDDLLGAVFVPDDGKVDPLATARALAAGARLHGATVVEGARVRELRVADGRVTGVVTEAGPVAAEIVVLATGMWSRQLAGPVGVTVPLQPVEHHYLHLGPVDGFHDDLPCTRDYDAALYFRPDGDGVWLGAFPYRAKPWTPDPIPADFAFSLFAPDDEQLEETLARGIHRMPALDRAETVRSVNGPESFTPDVQYLLGPAVGLDGLWHLHGFNSLGIQQSGGAGALLAEWISSGEPPDDLWPVDPSRFAPFQANPAYLRERVAETLGVGYLIPYPNREPETARGLRRSPFHDQLAARGARFGEKLGWERPLWFRRDGLDPEPIFAFERPGWLANVAAEHQATREDVAFFDQTSFAKYRVQGPEACATLQWLCSADVDVPAGKAVYTALLTERGTFMSDLIVLRLAEDSYYLVTAAAQQVHDAAWLQRHLRERRATLTDVTSSYAVLGVHGPRSRELLQPLTPAALDSATFPFHTGQWIEVGATRVLALRVSFVGELGWELHVPTEHAPALYETVLTAAGPDIAHAGFTALTSLRLEKAFGLWGADFSTADTPLEAAHAFLCAWDKPGGFLGREPLLRQRDDGVRRRLTAFVLDDPAPLLWGGEPIYRDGVPVGYTTSGGYGHTLGASVGLGYIGAGEPVSRAWVRAGSYEIEVNGARVPARAHLHAPYDAERRRMLA